MHRVSRRRRRLVHFQIGIWSQPFRLHSICPDDIYGPIENRFCVFRKCERNSSIGVCKNPNRFPRKERKKNSPSRFLNSQHKIQRKTNETIRRRMRSDANEVVAHRDFKHSTMHFACNFIHSKSIIPSAMPNLPNTAATIRCSPRAFSKKTQYCAMCIRRLFAERHPNTKRSLAHSQRARDRIKCM